MRNFEEKNRKLWDPKFRFFRLPIWFFFHLEKSLKIIWEVENRTFALKFCRFFQLKKSKFQNFKISDFSFLIEFGFFSEKSQCAQGRRGCEKCQGGAWGIPKHRRNDLGDTGEKSFSMIFPAANNFFDDILDFWDEGFQLRSASDLCTIPLYLDLKNGGRQHAP